MPQIKSNDLDIVANAETPLNGRTAANLNNFRINGVAVNVAQDFPGFTYSQDINGGRILNNGIAHRISRRGYRPIYNTALTITSGGWHTIQPHADGRVIVNGLTLSTAAQRRSLFHIELAGAGGGGGGTQSGIGNGGQGGGGGSGSIVTFLEEISMQTGFAQVHVAHGGSSGNNQHGGAGQASQFRGRYTNADAFGGSGGGRGQNGSAGAGGSTSISGRANNHGNVLRINGAAGRNGESSSAGNRVTSHPHRINAPDGPQIIIGGFAQAQSGSGRDGGAAGASGPLEEVETVH